MVEPDLENIPAVVKEALELWRPDRTTESVVALTPDASLRTYYRATYTDDTAVVMLFHSLACPEYEGKVKLPSDESYVLLSEFLSRHGVPVPELYFDFRGKGVLVIEDLGDRQLFDLLPEKAGEELDSNTFCFFKQAVSEIVKIQRIPVEKSFFAFARIFPESAFRSEMNEFVEYLFDDATTNTSVEHILDTFIAELAAEVATFPRVLTHRDFHAWNLLVDASDRLRLIDFQDALMAPAAYDLVALLNDRGMDRRLGPKAYRKLLTQYIDETGVDEGFYGLYDRVLLQRDLKVAGRFAKLVKERSLFRYEQWIPSTMQRIGRTLERLSQENKGSERSRELLSILANLFPDIAAGQQEGPWY